MSLLSSWQEDETADARYEKLEPAKAKDEEILVTTIVHRNDLACGKLKARYLD
jgi:hypothetical protein